VLVQERGEVRRARLFLSLDHDLHVQRQRPGGREPRLDRGGVHDDPRLVVRCPPTVEAAGAFGRLEGRTLPAVQVARGLDVVVRVQEQRRFARSPEPLAVDVGRRAGDLEQADALEPAVYEQRGDL